MGDKPEDDTKLEEEKNNADIEINRKAFNMKRWSLMSPFYTLIMIINSQVAILEFISESRFSWILPALCGVSMFIFQLRMIIKVANRELFVSCMVIAYQAYLVFIIRSVLINVHIPAFIILLLAGTVMLLFIKNKDRLFIIDKVAYEDSIIRVK